MAIGGSLISIDNFRFRFFLIIFAGIMLFGVTLYWRQQTLLVAQYVEFPQDAKTVATKEGEVLKSKNYQLETQDVSPSVK